MMDGVRQVAFQRLRPACVELSGVALKFRGNQATSKAVLQSLERLYNTLRPLGSAGALDEKLAEYAFFPISTCFNETKRLSSRCLELSIRCLQILVIYGWKQRLPAATGKQLLILLTWIAGGGPGQEERSSPSEELVTATLECMNDILVQLGGGSHADEVFNGVQAATVADQISYLLLEAVEGSPVETVQLAALACLRQLWLQISNKSMLASILPRTTSALTKALRSTTKQRKTVKVLVANLETLTEVIRTLFNDQTVAAYAETKSQHVTTSSADDEVILDKTWLNATTAQMRLALAQIIQLRTNERVEVREALGRLCVLVLEECNSTLTDSINLVIDTLVVICSTNDVAATHLLPIFKHLMTSNPAILEYMKSSLYSWTNSLPRIMQGNDDAPKQRLLQQISFAFEVLSDFDDTSDMLDDSLVNTLTESVTVALQTTKPKAIQSVAMPASTSLQLMNLSSSPETSSFQPVILDHQSQQGSLKELQALVTRLKSSNVAQSLTSSIVQKVPVSSGDSLLTSIWLSLLFLKSDNIPQTSVDMFLDLPGSTTTSRPYLIEELYCNTMQYLDYDYDDPSSDWRLTALSLEVLSLQALQLGQSFRTELIDVLYPVLALLGNPNPRLRGHAMTALNLLSHYLEYSSVSSMLIENVDYLINSVALKLNTFDLSPQGPQVMLMMLRLCGSNIVPYLDDLITSIFAALDTFHGYPRLVEILFQVLDAVVDESTKSAIPAIEGPVPEHKNSATRPSSIEDILSDLRARKKRKARPDSETDPLQTHPNRPWTSSLDGNLDPDNQEQTSEDQPLAEEDSEPLPRPSDDTKKQLSKPHTLLLSISRSTIPHLSSPSPQVRLTCLNLLHRITPLLARDENSFLPVVNDIWDAIVARLLSPTSTETNETGMTSETIYIQIAASKVVAALCENAGDFMSTRIEDIFPKLEKLYRSTWKGIEADRRRWASNLTHQKKNLPWGHDTSETTTTNNKRQIEIRSKPSTASSRISSTEPADLATLKKQDNVEDISINALSTISHPTTNPATTNSGMHLSALSTKSLTPSSQSTTTTTTTTPPPQTTTQSQNLHTSLLHLLSCLLSHVRVSDSIASRIMDMTSPALFGEYSVLRRKEQRVGTVEKEEMEATEGMVEALKGWNRDAVWVLLHEHGQGRGSR